MFPTLAHCYPSTNYIQYLSKNHFEKMETLNFQGIFPYQYLPVLAQSCQTLVTVANCFQCKALNSIK